MNNDLGPRTSQLGTELRAWASRSLACYALALHPQFQLPPHVRMIIEQLELMEKGKLTRLIVTMPPRHGKSFLATVLFVAWYIGRNPDHRVIVASYGQELADDFGRQVRNLVLHPRHRLIFPACRLSEDSTAANHFSTTSGGLYVAAGAGGSITGRGADLFIIDDPIKGPEDARSSTARRGQKEWFAQVARTRLLPGGRMALIQTRWHEDDLAGWLLREHSRDGWKLLSFPAIAECDDAFRKKGEPLWKERIPLEELEEQQRLHGTSSFAALFQQRPVPFEGAIFKVEWFRTYTVTPHFRRIVMSLDTAFKAGQEADFSAFTVWGEADDGFYLLYAWRGRVEFPELKRRVAEFASSWKPSAILIEDAASGQPLIQEFQRCSKLNIIPVKPKGDKQSRAHAVTGIVAAGRVLLPASAEWKEIFLEELTTFPASAHDDFIDSVTQALSYFSGRRYPLGDLDLIDIWAPAPEPWETDPYQRANLVELPDFFNRRR